MDINEVLSALKEDYALRNSLRRKHLNVQDELEDEIDDLEQSYITTHIMPQVETYAKELLKDMECELYLSVMKDANGDVRVSNEYDFDFLKVDSKEEEDLVVSESETQQETQAEDEAQDTITKNTRAGSIGFAVTFKDGVTIQHRDAKDTMIESLRKIGFEETAKFRGRLFKGFPLVGKKQRTDGTHKWQDFVDGWYIYTNMANDTKIKMLKMISDELHLGLKFTSEDDSDISIPESKDKGTKKRAIFSFNGMKPMNKRQTVLAVIKQYIAENPDTIYDKLKEVFPDSLQGSYGVFQRISWIEMQHNDGHDHMNRYFTDKSDLLETADGILIAVCTQWGDQFSKFVNKIKELGWTIEQS